MAADKALGIALDLAQQHNASLALMHVLLHDKEPDELLRLPDLDAVGADVSASLREIQDAPEPEHTAAELMGDPGMPNRPVNDDLLRKIGDRTFLEVLTLGNFSNDPQFERQGLFSQYTILF